MAGLALAVTGWLMITVHRSVSDVRVGEARLDALEHRVDRVEQSLQRQTALLQEILRRVERNRP